MLGQCRNSAETMVEAARRRNTQTGSATTRVRAAPEAVPLPQPIEHSEEMGEDGQGKGSRSAGGRGDVLQQDSLENLSAQLDEGVWRYSMGGGASSAWRNHVRDNGARDEEHGVATTPDRSVSPAPLATLAHLGGAYTCGKRHACNHAALENRRSEHAEPSAKSKMLARVEIQREMLAREQEAEERAHLAPGWVTRAPDSDVQDLIRRAQRQQVLADFVTENVASSGPEVALNRLPDIMEESLVSAGSAPPSPRDCTTLEAEGLTSRAPSRDAARATQRDDSATAARPQHFKVVSTPAAHPRHPLAGIVPPRLAIGLDSAALVPAPAASVCPEGPSYPACSRSPQVPGYVDALQPGETPDCARCTSVSMPIPPVSTSLCSTRTAALPDEFGGTKLKERGEPRQAAYRDGSAVTVRDDKRGKSLPLAEDDDDSYDDASGAGDEASGRHNEFATHHGARVAGERDRERVREAGERFKCAHTHRTHIMQNAPVGRAEGESGAGMMSSRSVAVGDCGGVWGLGVCGSARASCADVSEAAVLPRASVMRGTTVRRQMLRDAEARIEMAVSVAAANRREADSRERLREMERAAMDAAEKEQRDVGRAAVESWGETPLRARIRMEAADSGAGVVEEVQGSERGRPDSECLHVRDMSGPGLSFSLSV